MSWLEAMLLATLGETRRRKVFRAARSLKFLKIQASISVSLPLKY
jgi:hypothetical protein